MYAIRSPAPSSAWSAGTRVYGMALAHGVRPKEAPVAELAAKAVAEGNGSFLDELAGLAGRRRRGRRRGARPRPHRAQRRRRAGRGAELAARVEDEVARVCPSRPRVAVTEVEGNPRLQGALVAALEEAREQVFSDTV